MRPSTPGRAGVPPLAPMMMPPGTARPGTRGGLQPLRGPMGMPMNEQFMPPPSTGFRPPTGGIRPGTGMVLGGIPGTAAGRIPRTPGGTVVGGGLADVTVADRPVTMHGVKGMGTASQGPGRRVMDKSYFLGLLRTKISDLQSEMTRMTKESEQMAKDEQLYVQLARKDEALTKEVKVLQEKLADYNMLVDHIRLQTEVPEIKQSASALRQQNQTKKQQLDIVFSERTSKEHLVREVQSQIDELTRQAEQQINDLDPDIRDEYFQLRERRTQLTQQIQERQVVLESVDRDVTSLEMELNQDHTRMRLLQLQDQIQQRVAERSALETELTQAPLSGPEERQKLLAQVRSDNAEISEMEKAMRDGQDATARAREQLMQLDVDLQEMQGEKSVKVMELMKRDEEITAFLDSYDQSQRKMVEDSAAIEQSIVDLLDRISKGVIRQEHVPSQQQFTEMKSDAAHKQAQLQLAATTADKLRDELKARQDELEKINTLDAKIVAEMSELDERIKHYVKEGPKYQDLLGLREQAEQIRKNLLGEKQRLIKRKDTLKQQIASLQAKHEKLKRRLQDSETAVEMDGAEQKISQYEQSLHSLQEYYETKSRESNYAPIREECRSLLQDINQVLIKLTAQQQQSQTQAQTAEWGRAY